MKRNTHVVISAFITIQLFQCIVTTFFAAPFGVSLMTRPSQQQFLNDVYDTVYNTHEDYYEDSVTLFCLLVMTGNFWNPIPISPEIQDARNLSWLFLLL